MCIRDSLLAYHLIQLKFDTNQEFVVKPLLDIHENYSKQFLSHIIIQKSLGKLNLFTNNLYHSIFKLVTFYKCYNAKSGKSKMYNT